MLDTKARSVADLAQGMIVATVEIAVPPERVYRALASEEIVQWWGSEDLYRTQKWEGDVRPGGRWRVIGAGADGQAFEVKGQYLETEAPKLLSHTWEPDWDQGRPTRVTYRLESIEGGTRVTVRHEGFESRESCQSHGNGWTRVLEWLKGHFAPATAPRSFFLVRLLPPRPTFILDMSDDERRIMGEHAKYWRGLLAAGTALAFGPVADPKGAWGVGILELEGGEAAVKRLEAGDPVVSANIGFRYEILTMPTAVVR
jgi:uncharacterized protein YndB with AHSA1/START domain